MFISSPIPHRLAAPALTLAGVLLVPWVLYLAGQLPGTARARNWSLMWSGLDVAEALGLVLTGVLLWRHSPRRALPAAFTSALLTVDAWVDVTTSAPGHAKVLAILMASAVEVPAALACLALAVRSFPRAAQSATRPSPPAVRSERARATQPTAFAGNAPTVRAADSSARSNCSLE